MGQICCLFLKNAFKSLRTALRTEEKEERKDFNARKSQNDPFQSSACSPFAAVSCIYDAVSN